MYLLLIGCSLCSSINSFISWYQILHDKRKYPISFHSFLCRYDLVPTQFFLGSNDKIQDRSVSVAYLLNIIGCWKCHTGCWQTMSNGREINRTIRHRLICGFWPSENQQDLVQYL